MSNYGDRMISVVEEQKEIVEEAQEQKEENVFIETKAKKKAPVKDDEKKLKLKAHLAKCREKSAIVRKQKAQERKANKKPVGRPRKKKVIEEEPVVEEPEELEEEPEEEIEEEPEEDSVFKAPKTKTKPKPKPKSSPLSQPPLDIESLFQQFDKRFEDKLAPFITRQQIPIPTTAPAPTPQPVSATNQDFMNMFKQQEEMIRNDERNKIKKQQEEKKINDLQQSTKKYFGRLPPTQFIQTEPQNEWDKLLNVRKQDNYW